MAKNDMAPQRDPISLDGERTTEPSTQMTSCKHLDPTSPYSVTRTGLKIAQTLVNSPSLVGGAEVLVQSSNM